MTHHDRVRQVLTRNGFQAKDGRLAADMTDEEVEAFVVAFIQNMSRIQHQLAETFSELAETVVRATEPLRDLGRLLAEADIAENEEEVSSR
jgi:hypothetical protein